jgi:hypothetical protein
MMYIILNWTLIHSLIFLPDLRSEKEMKEFAKHELDFWGM